ncbi:cytochrome c3 family protein [Geoalkalibacter subterraneus]|uniref:Cytochrome C n=1 Tax=Geoalkalibacter subterraneus TaxID=483547 RepID=A0A0B5FET0_9BACT|nr:cytochrome c3 family protein [Geoalkalibacter subterraneus]AJF05828.1 cytochrome C [Geoalkalibacter subterraneus]
MKKFVVAAMVVLFAVGVGFAAQDMYSYEAKNGAVPFDHKMHSEEVSCEECHGEGTPAKIEIDKDSAHGDACKNCHKAQGGPTKCGDCHIK